MIIVTGAAGFIGSHTVDRLLADGHEVVGVDNLRTGRLANLDTARASERFRFVQADVADAGLFEAIVTEVKPAAIVHLAALVSVPESIEKPAENFRLNLVATHVVAEAARRAGVPRIVFASSAAVYGRATELPLDEARAGRPVSPYGAAKLASEALLLGHAASFGTVVRCHRYFNVFGPRQDPSSVYSGVISRFVEQLTAGRQPTIFGDGEQTRDFIFVGDVARANVLAATAPGVVSGVANICTARGTSLNELCRTLGRLLGREVAPAFAPERAGDVRHSVGDPRRATAELGFAATVSVEDGLRALLAAGG
jgi:UDP-glucose 4-epimerase